MSTSSHDGCELSGFVIKPTMEWSWELPKAQLKAKAAFFIDPTRANLERMIEICYEDEVDRELQRQKWTSLGY